MPPSHNKQTDKTANNKQNDQKSTGAFLFEPVAENKNRSQEQKKGQKIIKITHHGHRDNSAESAEGQQGVS